MQPEGRMKIVLVSEEEIRLEVSPGAMTIEADSYETVYSPYHMLGSSLATCTFGVLSSWASQAKINAGDLVISVSWTFGENPHRVDRMNLRFEWPSLPPERRKAAERAASLCPVHHTLTHSPEIVIEAAG